MARKARRRAWTATDVRELKILRSGKRQPAKLQGRSREQSEQQDKKLSH